MLIDVAPPPIKENYQTIQLALRGLDRGDAALAEALWINWSQGHYRRLGFTSVGQYMREAFKDTDVDDVARVHARSVQRLIKEWKVAAEIPVFRRNFDRIRRSNRRLIVNVMTPTNADLWVARGIAML